MGTNRYPRFNCFFSFRLTSKYFGPRKVLAGPTQQKSLRKVSDKKRGGGEQEFQGWRTATGHQGCPIRTSGDENTNYGTGDRFTLGLGTRPSFAGIAQGCDDPPEDRITGLRPWPHDAATQRRPDRAHDDK